MAYQSSVDILVKFAAKGKQVLRGVTSDLRKTGTTGQKSANMVTSAWKNVNSVMAGATALFATSAIKRFADAGQASVAVEDAFERLNKKSSQLIRTLRRASGSILDDTTLQKIANKLQAVGLSAGKMSEVLDLGMKLAAHSGRNYVDVVNQLTQALLSGETESFKTLGVIIDTKKAIADFARENNKAVGDLTKLEVAQAKVNGVLRTGQENFGAVDTSNMQSEYKKATIAANNLWDSITRGVFWVSNDLSKFVNTMGAGAKQIGGGFANIARAPNEAIKALAESMTTVARAGGPFDEIVRAYDRIQVAQGVTYRRGKLAAEQLAEQARDAAKALSGIGTAIITTAAERAMESTEKRAKQARELWDALDRVQKLETKSARSRSALDRAELAAAQDKLEYLNLTIEASDKLAASWEEARSQDALGAMAERAGQLSDALLDAYAWWQKMGGAGLLKTMLGVDATAKKPKKPRGTIKAKKEDRTAALLVDADRLQFELDMVKNGADETMRIKSDFISALFDMDNEELSESETKAAQKIEFIRATLDIEQYSVEEAVRLKDMERRAVVEADSAMARSAKERAKAEKEARAAMFGNVDQGISLANKLAHGLIKSKTALNIVDGLTEAARSAAAFARYDYWAGANHALASTMFFVAAGQGGKKGGGGKGSGGSNSFDQSATEQRLGASTSTAQQDSTIIVELVGMPEEYVDSATVRRVNRAGAKGQRINGAAVRPASAGRSGW